MVSSDERTSFTDRLDAFHHVEDILAGQFHDRESYEGGVDTHGPEADILPAYQPRGPQGPQVRLVDAINLVNRYCAKLPSDSFTHLTPRWHIENANGNFRCVIGLPINSPFKELVYGPVMKSRGQAKAAAALATVRALHRVGELDETLQPVGKDSSGGDTCSSRNLMSVDADEVDAAVRHTDEQANIEDIESLRDGLHFIGSAKRRQYYYKLVSNQNSFFSPYFL